MEMNILTLVYALLTLLVLAGIWLMSRVETARLGNRLSALAMLVAIVLGIYKVMDANPLLIALYIALGTAIGLILARRVQMIEMPQLVALLNGIGGGASALVGYMSLMTPSGETYLAFNTGSAMLAIVIGLVTLVGSLVAAGKLHRVLAQKSVVYPMHGAMLLCSAGIALMTVAYGYTQTDPTSVGDVMLWPIIVGTVASVLFGYYFAIRVGGADMPITISLLNSLSGLAGAIAGLATGDVFLVAIGGIVGASGLLLTQIMCRAMNRRLVAILFATGGAVTRPSTIATDARPVDEAAPLGPSAPTGGDVLADRLTQARDVIIVPGYGMALSQAQSDVYALAEKLRAQGARIRYAIHPVAGRMPGHMNVLLSEANVDYEDLYEMDAINGDFSTSDLVIVIGANDVLNPAARHAEGTPIYGMPVLSVDEASTVVICNYDLSPGYAGVSNPLYTRTEGVHLLLGDAKESLRTLLGMLGQSSESASEATKDTPNDVDLSNSLRSARDIIIVPGYGMALSQAQSDVYTLAEKLRAQGARIRYAIHPVAGRMPGHMNVLLSEANVDYEDLYEMDAINGDFSTSDLVIVIGANDVLNPAARHAEGTPIYGMPVLNVDEAPMVVICNYDLSPGYAGVPNPLYTRSEGVHLLLGDAKESLRSLIDKL